MTESRDYFPLSVKILVGVKGLEPLRPTALHPDIFDFLLCQSCEFRYNNPLRFPQKHSRTARLERVALLVVFSPQSFA